MVSLRTTLVLLVAVVLITALSVTLIHKVANVQGLNTPQDEHVASVPSGGRISLDILPPDTLNESLEQSEEDSTGEVS